MYSGQNYTWDHAASIHDILLKIVIVLTTRTLLPLCRNSVTIWYKSKCLPWVVVVHGLKLQWNYQLHLKSTAWHHLFYCVLCNTAGFKISEFVIGKSPFVHNYLIWLSSLSVQFDLSQILVKLLFLTAIPYHSSTVRGGIKTSCFSLPNITDILSTMLIFPAPNRSLVQLCFASQYVGALWQTGVCLKELP